MTVGVIGTTITPWMQFYLQSSIVEKGITVKQFKASRIDVIVGSIFSDVVAWFIVVACAATLFKAHGIRDVSDSSVAALAMKPLAGDYAFILFSAGLFNASLFAASILPLSTAYTVCEGLGFESGLDKSFGRGEVLLLVLHAAAGARRGHRADPELPHVPGLAAFAGAQWRAAALWCLLFMLKLINKHELMGKFTNSILFNVVAWATAFVVTGLTLVYLFISLRHS